MIHSFIQPFQYKCCLQISLHYIRYLISLYFRPHLVQLSGPQPGVHRQSGQREQSHRQARGWGEHWDERWDERCSSFIWIPPSAIWPPLSVYLGRKSQSSINISFRQPLLPSEHTILGEIYANNKEFSFSTFCKIKKNISQLASCVDFWIKLLSV